jgi:hypothetical protein
VLATLCGLNEKFANTAAIIKRTMPFPNFGTVHNSLYLEEIEMQSKGSPSSTGLVASAAPCWYKLMHQNNLQAHGYYTVVALHWK